LLPYSIDSETVPSAFRPASISLSRFPGRSSPPETKPGETPPPNLLKGLKNIPADVLVVPQASDLEKYWVECMHRGEIWRTKVLDVWRRENQGTGAKVLSELEKQMGREDERTSRWAYPVKGLNWVRSWMIWRRKFPFSRHVLRSDLTLPLLLKWPSSLRVYRPERH
jgi:hypothetical protein